jgi:hypothetical protein
MVRILYFVLIALILITFNSCIREHPQPYGNWKSDFMDISFIIDSDKVSFPGQYINNGEIIDIIINVQTPFGEIRIHDFETKQTSRGTSETIFSGRYRLKDDQLIYTLKPGWQEEWGIETIIFERVS